MAAVPAAIVGFAQAPILGAYTIVLSLLVQQSENNLIVPLVMKRAVGLNPIVILVVLVLGGKIAGVLGALLAIPFYLFVETVLRDILADAELRTFFRLWIK
jgi:predicted PurR-regulated permease PerM